MQDSTDRPTAPTSLRRRVAIAGRIVLAAVAVALLLAATASQSWAQDDCHGHGGLDRVAKTGGKSYAVCHDGTWHS